jgi:hypothetical protein
MVSKDKISRRKSVCWLLEQEKKTKYDQIAKFKCREGLQVFFALFLQLS